LPDGQFLPPMKMSCGELRLKDRVKAKLGHTVTIGRVAVLTQNHNGRLGCHFCGPCERGCRTFSYFSSPFTTVADAQNSGNCTLITNAVVSHVNMDNAQNKASGVTYIDRVTRQVKEVRGKTVILCAQALESTRILLNSSTREHPGGLGNSSGALGHYLMDHVTGGGATGYLPDMKIRPNANEPQRPNGIYVPRFRNTPSSKKRAQFLRGYGYQGGGGMEFNFNAQGYGTTFKGAVKEGIYSIGLGAFGESLARWDNYCEIDNSLKDAWGIPALRISMTHGENEAALMADAAASAAEMLEAAGAKDIKLELRVETPGMAIHELGTARMGNDPKKSVLNPFNQTHDIKNLFVMDGASFVSSACQNPTLTMMAVAVRACTNLIDRFHKNEV
jgi:choline dehydrogenase-like flavoprotein